jgi:OOP family OmpA-OmpF porin
MILRKRTPLTVCAVALLAAAAAPAFAENGLYVGALVGQSLFHEDRADTDAAVVGAFESAGFALVGGTSSLDKTDVAFGGVVGYRFMPEFAVEAGYIDLGKLNYKLNGGLVSTGFTTFPATANLTAEAKGPTLAAVGILPLSRSFEIYGRLGVLFSKVKLSADISVSNLSGSDSQSANSVDGLIGVGLGWHVADHLTLRAEYTRFSNVGDKDTTGETNIDLFNVGVTYSFH